jgi:DNA-binding IclR family transcriptional regulator
LDGPLQTDRVKSAGRVLDLIEILAEHPEGLSFTTLFQKSGFPKSSLHALLSVLSARRYVQFDEATRLYSLGIQVWQNGQSYLKSRDIVREARPVMNGIAAALNETVQLAYLDGTENVYLAKVDSTHPLRLQSEVGVRLSAHATGVGKALLAGLTDDEVRRRFGTKPLARMTENTITTVELLLKELARIRSSGFAIDNEEYTPGVFCLAVPVYDHTGHAVVAISTSVPVMRLSPEILTKGLSLLCKGSVEVTKRIGGQHADCRLDMLQQKSSANQALTSLGILSWAPRTRPRV